MLLEQQLQIELFFFSRLHHISELSITIVCDAEVPIIPDIPLFEKFWDSWINQNMHFFCQAAYRDLHN